MGKLIYSLNVSLDGFAETPDHRLDWAIVDEELHTWFNDEARGLDAFIYGRRMYELMAAYWPTAESDPSAGEPELNFARIWTPKPKMVFSSSLERVDWNGRLVSGDPAEQLAKLREEFDGDMGIGGATLAGAFMAQGLIDEYRLVVHPVVLGAGIRFFPGLSDRIELTLLETKSFESGAICLRYVPARRADLRTRSR